MIQFEVNGFDIPLQLDVDSSWLHGVARSEGKDLRELNIQFFSDEELHQLNMKFLNHDTFTDIITFDRCRGDLIKGDLAISWDRVKDHASIYDVSIQHELHRVLVHGLLHLCGYGDKSEDESRLMRLKESEYLERHVDCSTWNK